MKPPSANIGSYYDWCLKPHSWSGILPFNVNTTLKTKSVLERPTGLRVLQDDAELTADQLAELSEANRDAISDKLNNQKMSDVMSPEYFGINTTVQFVN